MKRLTILLCLLILLPSLAESQTVVRGEVSGRWWKDGSPYVIDGDVVVPAGRELMIDAGVTVRYKPRQDVSTIEVRGSLVVLGEDGDSVLFTSNALRPTSKDWGLINVIGGDLWVSHAVFTYYRPAIAFSGGTKGEIANSRFARADLQRGGMADTDTTVYVIGGFMPDSLQIQNCTLDGNNRTKDGVSVYTDGKGHLALDSLRIHNFTANGIYASYTGNNPDPATRSVVVSNSYITQSITGIYLGGGTLSDYRIQRNRISECTDGVNLLDANTPIIEIEYNELYNNSNRGMNVQLNRELPYLFIMRQNLIHHNLYGFLGQAKETQDIQLWADIQSNTIAYCYQAIDTRFFGNCLVKNNIFAHCDRFGRLNRDGEQIHTYNVCFNRYWVWPANRPHLGAIYADPLFVDEYDFHLQPQSPAIDRGDPQVPVGDEPVPNGGRVNIGAYGGTVEATTSTLQPLGPILSSAMPQIPFSLINISDTLSNSGIPVGNMGDRALRLESYTLSDTINFNLRYFLPLDLGPLQETPSWGHVLYFTPKVAKEFQETLTYHSSAGDLVIPIYAQSTGQPIISGNLPQGTTIWTKEKSPYIIEGTVTSKDTDTLIIEQGVTLLYNDSTSRILSYGVFRGKGTPREPILFVSLKEYKEGILGGFGGLGDSYVRHLSAYNIGPLSYRSGYNRETKVDIANIIRRDIFKNINHNLSLLSLSNYNNADVLAYNLLTTGCGHGIRIALDKLIAKTEIGRITSTRNQVGVEVVIVAGDEAVIPPEHLMHNSIISNNDIGIDLVYARVGLNVDLSVIKHVCLWVNSEDGWIGKQGGLHIKPLRFENVLRADPLFIGSPNYEFHLHKNSPCIDTGNPEGEWDPDGSPPDFGAFPFDHNNIPAEVERIEPNGGEFTCEVDELLTFEVVGIDPEEFTLDYLWQVGDRTFWGEPRLDWTFDTDGEYMVAVQSYDGYNFSSTVDWLVRVAPLSSDRSALIAEDFTIHSVYPNPFNDLATLRYTLPGPGVAELTIYDVQGRTLLYNRDIRSMGGTVTRVLDFGDYPAGLYFLRMSYEGVVEYRKMVCMK